MVDASDLWPPFGLVIRAGDLRLTPVADDDLPGLVELVLAGIHDPDWMPFDAPWTLAPPAELPRRYAQHYWEVRAAFRPEDFTLDFAVRQRRANWWASRASPRVTSRCSEPPRPGPGWVRRSRDAGSAPGCGKPSAPSCSTCSARPRSPRPRSSTTPASLAVSRKVGYRSDGTVRKNRQGTPVDSRRLLLDPDAFVRGEPIEVTGAEPLRAFLGVA